MFGLPGGMEWIVIGLVALLLFGKRLPGVARSLGQAFHEFKAGLSGKLDEPAEKTGDVARDADKKPEDEK